MEFITWMGGMRPPSRYILSRGLILTCLLLASCLCVLLRARSPQADTLLLLQYADHIQTMALIVLGTCLIGSALMEDVLEYTGGA